MEGVADPPCPRPGASARPRPCAPQSRICILHPLPTSSSASFQREMGGHRAGTAPSPGTQGGGASQIWSWSIIARRRSGAGRSSRVVASQVNLTDSSPYLLLQVFVTSPDPDPGPRRDAPPPCMPGDGAVPARCPPIHSSSSAHHFLRASCTSSFRPPLLRCSSASAAPPLQALQQGSLRLGQLQAHLAFFFRRFASLVASCFGAEAAYKAWHRRDVCPTPPCPCSRCPRHDSPLARTPLARAAARCLPCRLSVRPHHIHPHLLLPGSCSSGSCSSPRPNDHIKQGNRTDLFLRVFFLCRMPY
jgi:hypothetical protein